MWGVRVGVYDFRRELYTHIHLDYDIVEILSCKLNKFKKKKKQIYYGHKNIDLGLSGLYSIFFEKLIQIFFPF